VVNLPTQPTSRRVTPVAQTESEIESIRRLILTKEARDKEDKYEALHGENDRRIRKLNAITMAEDAELERQIEETIVQLYIDQLPRLTVPRNHAISTRHHSPPAVAQCALKDCNKDAFVIGGTASLCCSRSHLKYLQAIRSKNRCALPECERPVHFRPDILVAYDFCCINHAKLANKYGNKPKAGQGEIKCGFPSCDNRVFYYSTTGHYDFCGMTCKERMANLPVTPPMLELTCTQFTTLVDGAVPPPSNPPSAPESIIDYGTPPDSPSILTTQPAPLAIHPPPHPAPPATTNPPIHIPLALLPTPMPEAYVSNWATHYITGSSNLSPVRTLSVADTHSVRSTPPVTPPLPHTEVAVFIARMKNEPGETPSCSSHIFPRMDHEDEAPPPSNPASAPASDYDESESESLSDSSSHGGSHARTSVCSLFFPSTSLLSRALYAFSAASRSYSAVFKEIDNSPDVIHRRATRVITDARSKFGLDLHARHSRRVHKSRRTYNGNLASDPISLPLSAGGSYENSEDEASPLRGGEARTPEFAPEYGPSNTLAAPPGPPRRTFNPEQGHLFSYPISAAPAEGAAPPLISLIPSLPSTAPPAYSGLLSPHLRHSTPAPYPPPNPHFGMDSGYDAFHPWYDPNGDLGSHASLSSARSEPVAAPVPSWLNLGLELGLGPVPTTPVIATTPHVPVIATTPHVPVIATTPHVPVLVAAPYGPIPTVPRPASAYAESNASAFDDLRSEKNFHAREQAVYDQERKLLIETQKYESLNQEAALRDLRAVHAERKRLKDVELAHMQAQNKTAANAPQPRHTRFDSHEPTRHHHRTSTVPPVPATNHSADPLHTPGPGWFNAPATPQTHMPTPGISRKRVPYGRDEPEIESYKTPCPRDPYRKVFHPGDPKDQRNVSTDANSSHWIALFELSATEHAAVYIDSEDSE